MLPRESRLLWFMIHLNSKAFREQASYPMESLPLGTVNWWQVHTNLNSSPFCLSKSRVNLPKNLLFWEWNCTQRVNSFASILWSLMAFNKCMFQSKKLFQWPSMTTGLPLGCAGWNKITPLILIWFMQTKSLKKCTFLTRKVNGKMKASTTKPLIWTALSMRLTGMMSSTLNPSDLSNHTSNWWVSGNTGSIFKIIEVFKCRRY